MSEHTLKRFNAFNAALAMTMLEVDTLSDICKECFEQMENPKCSQTRFDRNRREAKKCIARIAHAIGMFKKWVVKENYHNLERPMFMDTDTSLMSRLNRLNNRFNKLCEGR